MGPRQPPPYRQAIDAAAARAAENTPCAVADLAAAVGRLAEDLPGAVRRARDIAALRLAGFTQSVRGDRYYRGDDGNALAWSEWVDLAEHILATNARLSAEERVATRYADLQFTTFTAPESPWILVVEGCDPGEERDLVGTLLNAFPTNPPLVSFMPMRAVPIPDGPWALMIPRGDAFDPESLRAVADYLADHDRQGPLVIDQVTIGRLHNCSVTRARCTYCQEQLPGERLDDIVRAAIAHDDICDHVF